MRYNVLWTPIAEQRLASLWLAAENRAAVTSAAHSIDRLLMHDPVHVGHDCFDCVRTLNRHPLGVDFEVVEAERLVYVLTVRLHPSPSPE